MPADEDCSAVLDLADANGVYADALASMTGCEFVDERQKPRDPVKLVDAVQHVAPPNFRGPGVLYVARGSRSRNGSDDRDVDERAAAAVRAGAAALLCDHVVPAVAASVPVLVRRAGVDRVVGAVASEIHGHPSRYLKVAAVTGTDGKTTTCYLTAAAFRTALSGTIGLQTTVEKVVGGVSRPAALTTAEAVDLQRDLRRGLEAGDVGAVIETSSIAVAQGRVDGVQADVGVFTNLSPDHLDLHGTMGEYFLAKAALLLGSRCGAAVVNIDDEWGWALADLVRLADEVTLYTVSASGREHGPGGQPVSVVGIRLPSSANSGVVAVRVGNMQLGVRVQLLGQHNEANALCALAAAVAVGGDPEAAAAGIASVEGVPGRLDPVANDRGVVAFVDYAHTPAALRTVLEACRGITRDTGGRLIVVAGCGGGRDRAKRPAMGTACTRGADLVVATSDNPRHEDPDAILDQMLSRIDRPERRKVRREVDRRKAIALAVALAREGDVLLVAGKGHERTQLLGAASHDFDDHEELARALGMTWTPPNRVAGVRVRQQ